MKALLILLILFSFPILAEDDSCSVVKDVMGSGIKLHIDLHSNSSHFELQLAKLNQLFPNNQQLLNREFRSRLITESAIYDEEEEPDDDDYRELIFTDGNGLPIDPIDLLSSADSLKTETIVNPTYIGAAVAGTGGVMVMLAGALFLQALGDNDYTELAWDLAKGMAVGGAAVAICSIPFFAMGKPDEKRRRVYINHNVKEAQRELNLDCRYPPRKQF
jgi:hypothetical protein